MRLIGSIDAEARRAAGYQWFNSLPAVQAVRCLAATGIGPDLAAEIESQRPLGEDWLSDQRRSSDDSTAASYRALASMIEGEFR